MTAVITCQEEAASALRGLNLVGLAPRPIDLLPLLRLRCLGQLWTCEAADPDWASRFGVETFSLEEALGVRERWCTADLDQLLGFQLELHAGLPEADPCALMPYGLTDRWRAAAGRTPQRLALPVSMKDARPELTSKIAMRRWLSGLGLPVPTSVPVTAADLDYRTLAGLLGPSFVLQVPTGSGGRGTFRVGSQDDIRQAVTRYPVCREWLASAYAGATTINFHGLVSGDGVVGVMRPSVQLSNLAAAGGAFGEYCGSDFGAPLAQPITVLRQARLLVRRIGRSLARRGYLGLFGVDLVVQDDGAVAVLEVNGRVQASTWLLGEIELAASEIPALGRHVLEMHGYPTVPHQRSGTAAGAQLVVRHTDGAGRVERMPATGVYAAKTAPLVRRRDGYGLADCGPDEVVVTDTPEVGVLVRPGAALGRLVTPFALTASDGQSLTSDGARLLKAFQAVVVVRPV